METNDKNNLIWKGEKKSAIADIEMATYKDHRMTMAFAPAALTHSSFKIADKTVVSKSCSVFGEHLQKAGFEING